MLAAYAGTAGTRSVASFAVPLEPRRSLDGHRASESDPDTINTRADPTFKTF